MTHLDFCQRHPGERFNPQNQKYDEESLPQNHRASIYWEERGSSRLGQSPNFVRKSEIPGIQKTFQTLTLFWLIDMILFSFHFNVSINLCISAFHCRFLLRRILTQFYLPPLPLPPPPPSPAISVYPLQKLAEWRTRWRINSTPLSTCFIMNLICANQRDDEYQLTSQRAKIFNLQRLWYEVAPLYITSWGGQTCKGCKFDH